MNGPPLSPLAARLARSPAWARYGLLLLGGAALAGVCWWFFLQALQQSLSAGEQAERQERAGLAQRLAAAPSGEPLVAQVRSQEERLSAREQKLPNASEAVSVWAAVHRASRQHQLRLELLKPGPVGTETPYPQQRAQLRLSGRFDDILAFTRTLAGAPSLVAVEHFTLAASPLSGAGSRGGSAEGDALVLEATLLSLQQPLVAGAAPLSAPLSVFSVRDAPGSSLHETPASTVSVSSGGAGDPFDIQRLALPLLAADAPAPRGPLQAAPLSSMRMVGSVRSGEQVAALLLIGGALHAVRVGDALGMSRGQVTEIRADGLTVREPAASVAGQASARSANLVLVKE